MRGMLVCDGSCFPFVHLGKLIQVKTIPLHEFRENLVRLTSQWANLGSFMSFMESNHLKLKVTL